MQFDKITNFCLLHDITVLLSSSFNNIELIFLSNSNFLLHHLVKTKFDTSPSVQ